LLSATTIAALFAASSAFAHVASTSQKGSLLIWPKITVDNSNPSDPQDTIVEISNDALAGSIHIECSYVNEEKGRVDFDFTLTAKQTVSWDVLYPLYGDHVQPPPFPTQAGNPSFPGNPMRGELVCFATNAGGTFQVAWNELTGTATVLHLFDTSEGVEQPRQAFKYNAWAFTARCAISPSCPGGLAPNNNQKAQGTAGDLVLSGKSADGEYDACPAANIVNFMPDGAYLGTILTDQNWLSVSSCDQDLRETYLINTTKLDFEVWNSNEQSFTGAYKCVDSVETVLLSSITDGSNFTELTLGTPNARYQVNGVSASPTPCSGSVATGLVAVASSSVTISGDSGIDQEIGNTSQAAGAFSPPGFVLWDPGLKGGPSK
jgi:hypothetical protein